MNVLTSQVPPRHSRRGRPQPWLLLALLAGLLGAAAPAPAAIVVGRALAQSGNTVQITLCNTATSGPAVLVGLATYAIPEGVGPGPGGIPTPRQQAQQVLYDFKQSYVLPGHCVVLTVRAPHCSEGDEDEGDEGDEDEGDEDGYPAFQADAFVGGVITSFAPSGVGYGARLIYGQIFATHCGDDEDGEDGDHGGD